MHMIEPAVGPHRRAGRAPASALGGVGCTGSCWGDHLHFEVRDGRGCEAEAARPAAAAARVAQPAEAAPRRERTGRGRILSRAHGPHPQLLDHRPHRPRQVDPGRSHPRAHRGGRPAQAHAAAARLDGPRARARDHDQGAGRAGRLRRRRRRDLPPAPDRHPRPRRLLLRGLAQPRRLRGGAAGRRRRPGRRGADRRQHLRGGRGRARADPGAEQGRPARAPSPSGSPARSPT